MFEFSALGLVILVVGLAYLMTVGRWLTPARIPVDADLVEEFDLEDHLTQVRVGADSAPIGLTVDELEERADADVRVLQHRRDGDRDSQPAANERVLEYDGADDSDGQGDRETPASGSDRDQRFSGDETVDTRGNREGAASSVPATATTVTATTAAAKRRQ